MFHRQFQAVITVQVLIATIAGAACVYVGGKTMGDRICLEVTRSPLHRSKCELKKTLNMTGLFLLLTAVAGFWNLMLMGCMRDPTGSDVCWACCKTTETSLEREDSQVLLRKKKKRHKRIHRNRGQYSVPMAVKEPGYVSRKPRTNVSETMNRTFPRTAMPRHRFIKGMRRR